MKIRDIISEGGMRPIKNAHKEAMSNLQTFPELNMSIGSAYLNYRFGIALAGAPQVDMPTDNYIGGDPVLTTYTDEEMDIINSAAKSMGLKTHQNWTGPGSKEPKTVNTQSTVAKKKKNKYGV